MSKLATLAIFTTALSSISLAENFQGLKSLKSTIDECFALDANQDGVSPTAEQHDGFRYYVINLKSSEQRLAAVSEKFGDAGLNFSRIEAVYGKDFDLLRLKEEGIYKPSRHQKLWLTPPEIGCYMSHRKLWEQFLRDDALYAVVLEDDVKFDKNIHQQVKSLVASAPANWSVIYLGCHASLKTDFFKPCRPENNPAVKNASMVELSHECVAGTWAYVVNRATARKLLTNSLPIEAPIDYAIKNQFLRDQKFGEFHAYCAAPEIVHMSGAVSEIGNRANCKNIACKD